MKLSINRIAFAIIAFLTILFLVFIISVNMLPLKYLALIFVIFILLLGNHALTYGLITLISICIFAISWYISKQILIQKDI